MFGSHYCGCFGHVRHGDMSCGSTGWPTRPADQPRWPQQCCKGPVQLASARSRVKARPSSNIRSPPSYSGAEARMHSPAWTSAPRPCTCGRSLAGPLHPPLRHRQRGCAQVSKWLFAEAQRRVLPTGLRSDLLLPLLAQDSKRNAVLSELQRSVFFRLIPRFQSTWHAEALTSACAADRGVVTCNRRDPGVEQPQRRVPARVLARLFSLWQYARSQWHRGFSDKAACATRLVARLLLHASALQHLPGAFVSQLGLLSLLWSSGCDLLSA